MDQIKAIGDKFHIDHASKPKGAGSDLFLHTLKERLTRDITDSAAASAPAGTLGEVSAMHYSAIETPAAALTGKTDQLLGLLEMYARGLGNPQKTLKDLEPLINRLQTEADNLLKDSDSILLNDGRIRQIARESALAAKNEYMKFQRGDYI